MVRPVRVTMGGLPFAPCPVEDMVIGAVTATMTPEGCNEWRYSHESVDRHVAAIVRGAPPLSEATKARLAQLLRPGPEEDRLRAERAACHKKLKEVVAERHRSSS